MAVAGWRLAIGIIALAVAAKGSANECGFIEEYGEGCAGATTAPQLRVVADCLAPLEPLTIELTNAPGAKPAFLIMGTAHFTVPISPSCLIQVGEFLPTVLPMPLPDTGRTAFTATLPRDSAGVNIFIQAIVLDAAAPFGLAASNPLGIYVAE
jgi:hypothetical protein